MQPSTHRNSEDAPLQILRKKFAEDLLGWWVLNRKEFPWRKTKDPYRILVAELLLRKTTARQVESLYEKFLLKYPTPLALSQAADTELEELIRPLGMERKRKTLLKAVADEIVRKYSGKVPASREELSKLPGVGSYTANAVLCFAYGADVPLVDTNTVRVFKRFFSFKPSKSRAKDDPALWEFVAQTIPHGKARDFNLAVIDFAHEICTPKKPHCQSCPLKIFCKYAEEAEYSTRMKQK